MSDRRNLLQESLAAIERLQAKLDASERSKHEPIAIVGAGCRYPGGIQSPDDLWRVVRDGIDGVSEVPSDRWDVDAHWDADPKAPGKMITRRGGFLGPVDGFDAQFFGISPREASTMDPQQRLLLETATEALESAGLATDRLVGSATGVFVGITTSDYGQLMRLGGPENSDVYSATGSALNAAAGRISFTYGFQGPCMAVDTACSSSLVAVHLACQSLRAGESDLALAGGVNVVLSPDAMVLFSKWGMMAPDGACKTFDAAADGFVRAEGCAMIALKRLSDAQAAGDPILAVIRGSAVNSDGRSSGLTVPNGPAQQAVLRKALASASLNPADIDYVEAHGTGTPLGDPIEIEALGAVMRAGRSADKPLLIGSIKTNLGHTEAASGLAGLLKVVMALRHETIPPHLHFSTPNPGIPWAQLPLKVPTTKVEWPRGARARRAGVSSFGFSGTNAHIIVEEAPAKEQVPVSAAQEPRLIVLSARNDAGLRASALRQADYLVAHADVSLDDLAVTLGTGRAHLEKRVAFVADSLTDAEATLRLVGRGETPPGAVNGTVRLGERPKIAFLFTGQGSQYAGMGRRLYDSEPVFRAALDRCATILSTHLDRPLLDVVFPQSGADSPIGETRYTQPALFAIEYSLSELWRSWGITPSIVMGHSVGEYVAACVAGVFSLEDGLALIAARAALMQALPPGGTMAAVFADEAHVAPRIAALTGRVSIAAVNGPEETVLSGDADAIAQVLETFTADGIKSRALSVSHAFHSPRLDPMLEAFERRASSVSYDVPRIPLVSNLTGVVFAGDNRPDARYWRRHAREAVRFTACIESLRTFGATALVEVGPHPTLLGLVARTVPNAAWGTAASLRQNRDDRREMQASLGMLFTRGASVKWDAVMADRGGRRISLPTYPFQRERHWVDSAPAHRAPAAVVSGHPLLGPRLALAASPATSVWQREISLETHPWVTDHRVQGAAIFPATGYIEMAIRAGKEVLKSDALSVTEIEVQKPLILHDTRARIVQTSLTSDADDARFAVHSRPADSSHSDGPWTAHVSARVSVIDAPASTEAGRVLIDQARGRCAREVDGRRFYEALAVKGNQWGPCFQGMDHVWSGDGEAVGRVRVATALVHDVGRYQFHPAVSDACGHSLVATVPIDRSDAATGGAFVGGGVREVRFYRQPVGTTLWTYSKLTKTADAPANTVTGDVAVYDESGALVSETIGARLWYLDETSDAALPGTLDDLYYRVQWQPSALGGPSVRASGAGAWIVFADAHGVAQRIARCRQSQGRRPILVTPGHALSAHGDEITIRPEEPADYQRVFETANDVSAVVHLWTADAAASALHIVRGVLGTSIKPRPRVWFVTRNTQPVVTGDRCDDPFAAALWGLGRSLASEHAELWGGLVDLPHDAEDAAADQLVREIEAGTVEDKIAFRRGQRYVARLVRRAAITGKGFRVRADGTYIVTGGLGGIGLAMARWLVDQGARHLVLIGRTSIAPRDAVLDPSSLGARRRAAVDALEAKGAHVEVVSADIAVDGALDACLDARREVGRPPIRGLFHAAGVLRFQALASQDTASLRGMLDAKAYGAWWLHRRLMNEPLECFVMCSSTSALLSSPLLGGYAAANACLDALAWHRRGLGLPALSVNWGTWGEVGMAVESGRGGDMLTGISTISTSRGLAALQELLDQEETQAAVMPVDWAKFHRAYPMFTADPFFSDLIADLGADAASDRTSSLSGAQLAAADSETRHALLIAYLRTEAARVLGLAADRLDPTTPLSSFGFDSLMAVQLKNRIESDLGAVIAMIQFLQGPSVEQLVPVVLDALGDGSAASTAAVGPSQSWEEGSL